MAAVHRVAVFNAHGEIINVVSQTDVVKHLHNNMDVLGRCADMTLQDLGLLTGVRGVTLLDTRLTCCRCIVLPPFAAYGTTRRHAQANPLWCL